MNKFLFLIKEKLGIDKSIAYSSGARIIQASTGFITLFFISRFLSGIEQGFYYTFGSIVAMQVFFELGFTGIITQYVAHEFSHLRFLDNGLIESKEGYKSRIASLLRFCVKWYAVISGLLFFALIIVGFVFFSKYQKDGDFTSWKIPWIVLSIGTIIKLFQSPFNSFLMGLGKVKEMSKISFFQQLITPLIMWLGLMYDFKLYVLGISLIINVTIWFFFVAKMDFIRVMLALMKESVTERISYMKEIFPYQWKIALSWVSGFFIFQLFNPVLFATEGAVVAGQMGMTISVLNGIQALSMSWISTKVPLYSGLIAKQNYIQLDNLFNKTLKQQALVTLGLLTILFVGVNLLNITKLKLGENVLAERLLPVLPMFLMMVPLFCNQFVNAWATYLRCHKREPYLVLSIVGGIACSLSTFVLGNLFGLMGIVFGYCMITIVLTFWGNEIYHKCKRQWHQSTIIKTNYCYADLTV
jgi:O-antigen/teichoic acid export membrane protein